MTNPLSIQMGRLRPQKGTDLLKESQDQIQDEEQVGLQALEKEGGHCYNLSHKRRVYARALSLSCVPIDNTPPRTSVHGTFPARILEWDATCFSRDKRGDQGLERGRNLLGSPRESVIYHLSGFRAPLGLAVPRGFSGEWESGA